MDKRCTYYGSSWCADFECEDCPIRDTEEVPNKDEKLVTMAPLYGRHGIKEKPIIK
jgi:hypothetical protein